MSIRLRALVGACLLSVLASQAALAESPLQQSLKKSIVGARAEAAVASEVIVVLQLNPGAGATREEAEVRMKELLTLFEKQPGYVNGEFLRNLNSASDPRLVQVTRWKSFDDWEKLFENADFMAEIDRQSEFVSGEASAFVAIR